MASRCDSGARRQRRGNPEEERERSAAAVEQDLISSLQLDLRLEILRLLPLKSAIRAGAGSGRAAGRSLPQSAAASPAVLPRRKAPGVVRGPWRARPQPLLPHVPLEASLARRLPALRRIRRRLRRRGPPHPSRRPSPRGHCCHKIAWWQLRHLQLPAGEPGAHFHPWRHNRSPACSFSALEVIYLHWVLLRHGSVRELVAACPRLHTLDLRDCSSLPLQEPMVLDVRPGARLRSLTVTRCEIADLLADTASGLCSFRYCGKLIDSSNISASGRFTTYASASNTLPFPACTAYSG